MWCRTVGCIVTLILSLLTAPLTSQAQQAAHVPRLGLLMPGSASGYASRMEAFRHGLRDLGYVEGRNITLEYRFADGQSDRLPALVAELVRLPVDVLVVDGSDRVRAAQHATTTIPIVMVALAIRWGRASSPASRGPGGTSRGWPRDPRGHRETAGAAQGGRARLSRVAFLWHRGQSRRPATCSETETAARRLGAELHPVEVREPMSSIRRLPP